MTQQLAQKPARLSERLLSLTANSSWQRFALIAILILSAFLNLFRLTSLGYRNTYYAAAVKDMLTSWHNFFFVSFDAGFVTVDKPPLGLWIQAASAELFGFHGWSLLLPQALAGVLSVALLYHLVSKAFGLTAGLVAALVLAVTPVAVAVERTNNSDGLLILTVMVAAWMVIRAVETRQLGWLLAGAVVVGLGFNIKMLEAFLVLPAFYLLYLLAAPVSWWRRFMHLGLATVILLVVSLSWAVVVDMTPVDQRPYVGSSSNNSELDLIAGYNGLGRLLGRGSDNELINQLIPSHGETGSGAAGGSRSAQQSSVPQEGFEFSSSGSPGGGPRNGDPGPLRLLDAQLAGQIGWLLPLAVLGLLAASWRRRPQLPLDREHQALVLWGMWLLTMVAFFSFAGRFNAYYMVMLAPAIAALVGAGVAALWSDYRGPGWRGWLLPLSLLGIGAFHAYIILAYYDEGWSRWLMLAVVGLCLVGALGLVFMRLRPRLKESVYFSGSVVAVGILALLVAPTVWVTYTAWHDSGRSVTAGPQAVQESSWGGPGGEPPGRDIADPALMDYLQTNRGDAKYLVATENAMSGAPIILNTDESDPVIDLGGFMGRDPVLSTDQLARLVDRGAVRFFLVQDRERMQEMLAERESDQQGGSRGGWGGPPQNEATSWIQDNCQQVPHELWQSLSSSDQGQGDPGMMRAQTLYECSPEGK
jgi:4-amino-4-deoxy-L-arabinose transferase-like glycosyltransferase